MVGDLYNSGVVQRSGGFGFTLKARHKFRLGVIEFARHFDGHDVIHTHIPAAINGRHPTPTYRALKLISTSQHFELHSSLHGEGERWEGQWEDFRMRWLRWHLSGLSLSYVLVTQSSNRRLRRRLLTKFLYRQGCGFTYLLIGVIEQACQ